MTNSHDGTVTRIDPETLVTKPIPVGNGPAAVAVNAAGAWIANAGDNALVRVDTETNAVVETTPVGDGPTAVLSHADSALGREQPRRHRHAPRSALRKGVEDDPPGRYPECALAAADGLVWVAIAQPPPQSPPPGGARFTTEDDFTSLDPAFGSWLHARDVREPGDVPRQAGTRGIAHRPGGRRSDPRADSRRHDLHVQDPARLPLLATVERGGHRDDVQVDDRAGRPIRTSRSPLSRSVSAASSATAPTRKGKAREIAGIGAQGSELTIRLDEAGRWLPRRPRERSGLRGPSRHARCRGDERHPLRRSLLHRVVHAAAATGSQAEPQLPRRSPHSVSIRSLVAIGVHPARGLEQVEAGTADYALELPRKAGPRLESAYGPGSEATAGARLGT